MINKQKHLAFRMLVFKEVAHHGSFTKAAEALGLTKSGVSQYLSQLETSLHTQLLKRTTRRLHLTEAGQVFLAHCESLETLLNTAADDIEELDQQPQGTLCISAPHALATTYIAPAITALLSRYPRLEPKLIIDDSPQNIVQEHIDIAVRVGDLADSSHRAKRLGKLYSILVASPQYLSKANTIETFRDINQHPFIATSWQQTNRNIVLFNKQQQEFQLPINSKVRVNNSVIAADMAKLGNGIALLPNLYVKEALQTGQLVHILPQLTGEQRNIYGVHHYHEKVPVKVRSCLGLIEDYLGDC